jgi:hypothetical protein
MNSPTQTITRRSFLYLARALFPLTVFLAAHPIRAQSAGTAFDGGFDSSFH